MITGGNLTSQPPRNQCVTQKITHNEIKENSEKRKKLTTQHSYSHSEILTTVWNLKYAYVVAILTDVPSSIFASFRMYNSSTILQRKFT